MRKLLALALVLGLTSAAVAGITIGPLSTGGGTPPPPSGYTPVVAPQTCMVSSGFVTNQEVMQTVGLGACTFTATCNSTACTGPNAIISWAITAQSCASCYQINSIGTLMGGANAANVGTETDTVTVTATNSTGTSTPVLQTLKTIPDGTPGAQAHGFFPQANLADIGKVNTLSIYGGSGYTNGTYTWTASGGGGSGATGTITVTGGVIGNKNYTITNEGSGYTSRPTILFSAGPGTGGKIIPTVYQLTPHNGVNTASGINWNVAGIDYPVGYDTTLALKDPTIPGNLPGCATPSGTTSVTINSSNCTVNGYNFALHNTVLVIAGGTSNVVVTNNSFLCTHGVNTQLYLINVNSGTVNGTIKYNTFNGGATNGVNCVGEGKYGSIASSQTGGSLVVEYNYSFNEDAKALNFGVGDGGGGNVTVTEQYNWWGDFGTAGGPTHGEAEYAFAGTLNYILTWAIKFNVMVVHSYAYPTANTSAMSIQADGTTIHNADVENNFAILQGDGLYTGNNNNCIVFGGTIHCVGDAPQYCGRNATSGGAGSDNGTYTGTSVMLNNLYDYSGGGNAYNAQNGCGTGGAAGFGAIADYNAGSGHTCNISTCN